MIEFPFFVLLYTKKKNHCCILDLVWNKKKNNFFLCCCLCLDYYLIRLCHVSFPYPRPHPRVENYTIKYTYGPHDDWADNGAESIWIEQDEWTLRHSAGSLTLNNHQQKKTFKNFKNGFICLFIFVFYHYVYLLFSVFFQLAVAYNLFCLGFSLHLLSSMNWHHKIKCLDYYITSQITCMKRHFLLFKYSFLSQLKIKFF